jgi:hypothetical protein
VGKATTLGLRPEMSFISKATMLARSMVGLGGEHDAANKGDNKRRLVHCSRTTVRGRLQLSLSRLETSTLDLCLGCLREREFVQGNEIPRIVAHKCSIEASIVISERQAQTVT